MSFIENQIIIDTSVSDNVKLFERELFNYKNLNHPYFPQFYGILKEKKDKGLIVEYIEGETLEKFITTRPNIEFKVKMKIIIQILFAILYSHSQGFFLRDLKSDNIMVDLSENEFLIYFIVYI